MNSYSNSESDPLEAVSFEPLLENIQEKEEEEIIPPTGYIDNCTSIKAKIYSSSTDNEQQHPEIPTISALPPRLRFKYDGQSSFSHKDIIHASDRQHSKSIVFSSPSASSEDEDGIIVRESSDVDISNGMPNEAPRRSLRYLGVNQPKYTKEAIIEEEERHLPHLIKNRKKKGTFYSDDDDVQEGRHTHGRRKKVSSSESSNASFRRFSSRSKPQVSYKEDDFESEDEDEDLIVKDDDSASSFGDEGMFSSSSRRNRRSSIVEDSSEMEHDDSSEENRFDEDGSKQFRLKKKKSKYKNSSDLQFQQSYRCLDGLISFIYGM